MASTSIVNLPYAGTTQVATVTGNFGIPVTAHIWGGGGGSSNLYSGAGGGYSQVVFNVKPGDVLTVATGQGGGAGGEDVAAPVTPTGLGGASYIALLFNTRYPPPGQDDPVTAYGNGDSFLDQWGVWNLDQNNITFTREYTINFPATANVIFQMSCNNTGTIALDGTTIINRPPLQNPNTPSQAFVNVTAGNHTITISGTGTFGALNRIGLIFGTGDQTSFSGGRGGLPGTKTRQGIGGGGGGATVLSLNGVVIGVGAGGGGGAAQVPANVTYITTRYTATVGNPYNWPAQPGVVVAGPPAGTNGYIVDLLAVDFADVRQYVGIFWTIVINGTVVYAGNREPVTLARPIGVGEIYYFENSPSTDYAKSVDSFEYISPNTSATTDAMFNGQNGQDVIGYNYPLGGGGGGGGGGIRGGQGGVGVSGANGVQTGNGIFGGRSGHDGLCLGTIVNPSVGRNPFENEYYPGGGVAVGGASNFASPGGNGFVAFVFQIGGGVLVKDNNEWKPTQTVYVKDAGIWKEVQTIYINVDGIWQPVQGAVVPTFESKNVAFGVLSRPFSAALVAPPPAPDYGSGGFTGYGSNDVF